MRRLTLEHHRTMAFQDWPRQDREAWNLAVANGDALTDPGWGAGWRPATQSRYTWLYGHWLVFLKYRGRLDLRSSPADRASREYVVAFVESLRDRNLAPQTIATYVQGLHNALWAMAPDHDWAWLRELVNFLVRNAHPVKNRQSRLWPIHDVYEAGICLMDRTEHMIPKRPLQDSIWFRDGLMVALLAACALRRRNFANLIVGRHITRLSDGYWLSIPAREVKNRQRLEGPLPRRLTPYIDRYLEHHRPILLQGQVHSAFWIRQDGLPFSENTLSGRVMKVTSRLGYPMAPHDFRTSAATTIATVVPELARIIGHFLGHKRQQTSETYYNKATMLVACRRHGNGIMARRDALASQTEQDPEPVA